MVKGTVLIALAIVVGLMTIAPVSLFEGANASSSSAALPESHMIASVPWHQQINGLSCGAASLEIVYDYWGPDIDQKQVMNVARTSSSGTWTYDIVSAGQFSYMSDAQGDFFPSVGPDGGYSERPLGYAAFSHTSTEFWLEDLKVLIANDIPVIVLMNYYPDGGGGHYRVVIGYDDASQLVYFSDPWGRDLNHLTDWTGVINWTYSDFQMGWNYCEYGADNPYFGAVLIPWTVDVSVKGKTTSGSAFLVTATIQYPCPAPFDRSQFRASDALAQISLPVGATLAGGSASVQLGPLSAGGTAVVSWTVLANGNLKGDAVSVTASGLISGSVPEAYWAGGVVYYPAYSYQDAIGGIGTLVLG